MSTTIPHPLAVGHATRLRRCPICDTPPGVPCQVKPPADHLGRFLDAFISGQLSRVYLAAVVGELVVITPAVLVAGGAR